MTIPPLFHSVFAKSLVLYVSVLLTACSTEESYNGSAGVGVSPSGASISEVALSWVAPVEREDGTPISMSEIAGYRVYFGTSTGNYTNAVDIADSNTMQVTLSSLVAGTYYIVVTTYDIEGRESAYSTEIITSV